MTRRRAIGGGSGGACRALCAAAALASAAGCAGVIRGGASWSRVIPGWEVSVVGVSERAVVFRERKHPRGALSRWVLDEGGGDPHEIVGAATFETMPPYLADRYGRIYIAEPTKLVRLDDAGRPLWTAALPNEPGVPGYHWVRDVDEKGAVALCGSVVEAGVRHGFVALVDPAGKQLWKRLLGREIHHCAIDRAGAVWLAGHFMDRLALAGQTLQPAGANMFVAQLSAAGDDRWVVPLPSVRRVQGLEATDQGTALMIAEDYRGSYATALGGDGSPRWTTLLGSWSVDAPLVAGTRAALVARTYAKQGKARFGPVSVTSWYGRGHTDSDRLVLLLALIDTVSGRVSRVRTLPSIGISAIAATKQGLFVAGNFEEPVDLGAGRLQNEVMVAQCRYLGFEYKPDVVEPIRSGDPCPSGATREVQYFTRAYVAAFPW